MTPIEFRAKVGPDGVLAMSVPVGLAEANREVRVVVESLEPGTAESESPRMTDEEWQRFLAETSGSVDDPSFRRHEQGDYESRDTLP